MSIRTYILAAATISITAPLFADEVNIYSYRQPFLIEPILEAFTEETGIDVNVAFMKSGMVERLKAEGSRTPADVLLTVDIARLNELVEAELTQSVQSSVIAENVPDIYRDPENLWLGVTTRARIVYASADRVGKDEITHYGDLANPKWKGRICMRSGLHPYNVALTSAYLLHHGEEETLAWLEGIKSNLARSPQGNDRAQVKAIWAGECDISLGNTYYMGAMLADEEQKEWAQAVEIRFPTFEGGGTHMNISGVAIAKHAPHAENALKLVEFLTSPTAQEIYASINHEYPVAPDANPSDLVVSWGEFDQDQVNLMRLAVLRPEALRLIEKVNFDQ